MRTRLTNFCLALGTTWLLALTACASDFNSETESESESQSDVTNRTHHQLYKPVAPHPANVCCVAESLTSGAYCGKITNEYGGTWCCGWAKCTDKEICGDDYDTYLDTCTDCAVAGCSNPHGYPQPVPENELKPTEAPAAEPPQRMTTR